MNLSSRNKKKQTVPGKNTPRGQQTSYCVYYSLKNHTFVGFNIHFIQVCNTRGAGDKGYRHGIFFFSLRNLVLGYECGMIFPARITLKICSQPGMVLTKCASSEPQFRAFQEVVASERQGALS